jgi:8-oxo-dGTP diphosphatase
MALRDGELKRTVLVFMFDRPRNALLMIFKKRGQGAGKVNVPGGKLRAGESAMDAAARECMEETGLRPLDLREVGRLEFNFPESENWDNTCVVFSAESFDGILLPETEECTSRWVPLDQIPVTQMWDADRLWLPLLLAGKPFHRAYVFDRSDKVIEERVLGG